MLMIDNEWIEALKSSLPSTVPKCLKSPLSLSSKISDSDKNIQINQHIECVMCYVAHLPTKSSLIRVITKVINKYPQLKNLPIIGENITQSSFEQDDDNYRNVNEHIFEYRLNKKQIDDLDEMMTNKVRMDLSKPRWDIFLITPEVANDIKALDPQHAILSVIVFRFHQSVIDLATINQFLHDISSEFIAVNGMDDFFDDDDEMDSKSVQSTKSSQNIFGSPQKYPSQFNLPSYDGSNDGMNGFHETTKGESSWYQEQMQYFKDMMSAGLVLLNLLISNGNVFDTNNGFAAIQVISERFEDTSLMKIGREAEANLSHICRACIAGALLRYFEDKNDKNALLQLEHCRILETFDFEQKSAAQNALFSDGIGLTSIDLCIGDDYQTSRSRLMSISHPYDVDIYRRIAIWIHNFFKFVCTFLPDLVSKKIISMFYQRHTMEMCYFEFGEHLVLGTEPVEDLRVFKSNLNVPCLCVSSYNDHISLDLSFTSIAIKNPALLIQGFLAELEQLEAMFR